MAAKGETRHLVTCEWLQEKITSDKLENVVILDVSWSSKKDCHQQLPQRYIPGAQYLNVMVGPHTELFPRSLPPPDVFQEAARAAGVRGNSHVVLYSDSDNNGFFLSARAWWTFMMYGCGNVSVLNGGLQRWLGLGYPTTPDCAHVKRGDFTARYCGHYRRTFEDVLRAVSSGDPNLLDSRPPTSFSQGHIQGANSLHYKQLVDSDSQEMMPPRRLKEVLERAGVDFNKQFTSYCNSGMSSCTLALAFSVCGGADFAVYHGGFTEWMQKASHKIEKC